MIPDKLQLLQSGQDKTAWILYRNDGALQKWKLVYEASNFKWWVFLSPSDCTDSTNSLDTLSLSPSIPIGHHSRQIL